MNFQEEEEDEENDKFWKTKSYHTPEDRMLLAQKTMSLKEKHESSKTGKKDKKPKTEVKLFNPAGRPYNMNQPKIPFDLDDEYDRENIILEVHVYK